MIHSVITAQRHNVKLTRNPQKTLRSIRGLPEQLIGLLIVLRVELKAE